MLDPNHLPDVADDEDLCRFVFQKGDITATRVKVAAFVPEDSKNAISVMRRLEASEEEIRSEGSKMASMRGRGLKGYGQLTAKSVRDAQLDVVPKMEDGNPNHADVIGWPEGEGKDERRLEVALKLSMAAVSVRF